MIFCGNWVLNAQKFDDNDEEAENLYSYIKGFAKDFGVEDWVQYDKDSNTFYLSQEKEFEFHEEIEKYHDEAFWNELVDCFVVRDIHAKYSEEEWKNMSIEEKLNVRVDLEKRYDEEFVKNGVDNLHLSFAPYK